MSAREHEKTYKKTYTEKTEAGEVITGQAIVRYKVVKGRILDFSLSLNYKPTMEENYEVYRADTSNGGKAPHEHLFWRGKNQERPLRGHEGKNYNQLFNQVLDKIDRNFLTYILRYKKKWGYSKCLK